jgi:hypothetical protein
MLCILYKLPGCGVAVWDVHCGPKFQEWAFSCRRAAWSIVYYNGFGYSQHSTGIVPPFKTTTVNS